MSTQAYCTVDTDEINQDERDQALENSLYSINSEDASIFRCSRRDANSTQRISHLTSSQQVSIPQRRQRRLAVMLLFACVVLVFADQNLMAPNLSKIASEFGFDATERDQKLGGDIAFAFFLLGAPASFIVGMLADHYNRIYIFTATMLFGEGACFLTYFIKTYRQLYICRAVTGLSVGGILPLIYSLLGDMFAAEDRHTASSYVGTGLGLGISLGHGVAGFLGPIYGWRMPFLVVSIPAIVFAVLLLIFVHEPERGAMEEAVRNQRFYNTDVRDDNDGQGADYSPPALRGHNSDELLSVEMSPLDHANDIIHGISSQNVNDEVFTESRYHNVQEYWSTFLSLLLKPTLLLAFFQGAPGCVPWGIVNTYLNDFLQVDRNMTGQYATLVVLIFGVGNFIGMLLGGYGGAYLYLIDRRYPALLAGVGAIASCFPFWILLNRIHSDTSMWIVGSVSICTGVASGITGPIIKATVQNVTLPNTRGQAFAIFNTFDDMGRGLGPVFVASMIVRFGGRTKAFNIGVLGWIVCGIANLCVFFTVHSDERRVQSIISNNLYPNTISQQ